MKSKPKFENFTKKNFLSVLLKTFVLNFTLFIYLPIDSFVSNIDDFENSIREFAFFFIGLAILLSAAAAAVICLLPKKLFNAANGVVFGLTLDVYLQYMFMNGKLKLIDGDSIPWEDFRVFSVINAIIWIAILAASVIVSLKAEKVWAQIHVRIPAIIGAVQLVALVTSLASAGSSIFSYRLHLLSGKEQYVVSKNENIIVLMLDAVDNRYIKEVMETQPEAFDGLEDFTMYTNTCSVFDSTRLSMAQMYMGMGLEHELSGSEWFDKAWNSDRADEFFGRLHNAGYTVNMYNIDTYSEKVFRGKFDNFDDRENNKPDKSWHISYGSIRKNFFRLIGYRTFPFALKKYLEPNIISFANKVTPEDEVYYDNEDFEKHLSLSLSDSSNKYFITEHISGTHDCGDEKIETTVYLMGLVKKYLSQLKELGVYDSSTIIITADHGRHNQYNPENAATPMLFIKRRNETSDDMRISSAPVYHRDFQATVLECAGLYDKEKDYEMFGPTMFDFNEGDKRERYWYDRGFLEDYPVVNYAGTSKFNKAVYNVYYGYTYTGDTADLERIVANREMTIYPMKDYKD